MFDKRPIAIDDNLVDIVDENNKLLGIMALSSVHAQELYHRSVLVLVYNEQGKLFLQKKDSKEKSCPEYWDFAVMNHVNAGEAREDAARRELSINVQSSARHLSPIVTVRASADTAFEFVTLYTVERLRDSSFSVQAGLSQRLFVDWSELSYMRNNYQEMLAPVIIYMFDLNLLFPITRTSVMENLSQFSEHFIFH